MTGKLFLFNEHVVSLDPTSDPRLDPSFPLSQPQYEALTVENLMQLLREEFHSDPGLPQHKPKVFGGLCALLNAKGGVNCVKLHWDGYGMSSRHGKVPDTALAALSSMESQGSLTEAVVEDAVWSKMPVA